ncbi:MAG: hypothetical protein R3E18_10315 [Sphingomonadaceae bacterium]|nr:hypothetical protein [Sphingomonadaceae bacterium]
MKHAMAKHGGTAHGFLNSAAPGLTTAFQPNQYYKTHEDYLADLAEARIG